MEVGVIIRDAELLKGFGYAHHSITAAAAAAGLPYQVDSVALVAVRPYHQLCLSPIPCYLPP